MPYQVFGDVNGNGIVGAGTILEFIESNGNIDITLASGAAFRIKDNSGNILMTQNASSRPSRLITLPLNAVNTAGGAFSWQNPEATSIIIDRIEVYVSTAATGAATLSVGSTATSGTTSAANLIDTLDVHSATGAFDNITDKGTNGKSRQLLASGKWVTGSQASGDLTGIVGNVYIHYHLV